MKIYERGHWGVSRKGTVRPRSRVTGLGWFAVLAVLFASETSANDEATRRLIAAADKGDATAIRSALGDGARIDESSELFAGTDRQPSLVAAALRGHANVVRMLLEEGANPLSREKDGFNVWHAAAFQGRTSVLRVLVDRQTPGYVLHPDGFTPLHRACWGRTSRHTAAVRLLITDGGRACDERTQKGRTPLALTKNPRTAVLLRECGLAKEPRTMSPREGDSSLPP